jgi:hypothetical protein
MQVLINSIHYCYTRNDVLALDIYNHSQIIHALDYAEYNFSAFKSILIDGRLITNNEANELTKAEFTFQKLKQIKNINDIFSEVDKLDKDEAYSVLKRALININNNDKNFTEYILSSNSK